MKEVKNPERRRNKNLKRNADAQANEEKPSAKRTNKETLTTTMKM